MNFDDMKWYHWLALPFMFLWYQVKRVLLPVLLILVLLLIGAVLFFSQQASAQGGAIINSTCFPRDFVDRASKEAGRLAVWQGHTHGGDIVRVYGGKDGDWTVAFWSDDSPHTLCVIAGGSVSISDFTGHGLPPLSEMIPPSEEIPDDEEDLEKADPSLHGA